MNTPLSLALGGFIITGLILDTALTGGENILFLTRKFTDLTEWIAFWR